MRDNWNIVVHHKTSKDEDGEAEKTNALRDFPLQRWTVSLSELKSYSFSRAIAISGEKINVEWECPYIQ